MKFLKIGCGGMIVMFVILMIIGAMNSDSNTNQTSQTKASENEFGVSEENHKQITNTLNSLGIEKLKNVKHDALLDNAYAEGEKGYRFDAGGLSNIVIYISPNQTVNRVKYAGEDLFAKDEILYTVDDFGLTTSEMSDLQYKTESAVKDLLKAPSTAKFAKITERGFSKNKGEIIVQSYVDSQNGFGAMLRAEFQVKINKEGKVTSFIFDGREYIK